MSRTLQVTVTLKDEFLSDIIINASETAFSWFNFRYGARTWLNPATGQKITNDRALRAHRDLECEGPFCICAPFSYDKPNEDEGTLGGLSKLDFDTVTEGLRRIISGECKCGVAGEIAAAVALQDAGQIDANLGDCIVQAAVFGEIVYG